MTTTTQSARKCLHCGRELTGRHKKYCSDAHRQAYKRQQKKSDSGQTVVNGRETVQPVELVPLDDYRQIESDLQAAQAVATVIGRERDRLAAKVDELSNELKDSEYQRGMIAGELASAREQIGRAAEKASADASTSAELSEKLRALERENGSLLGQLEASREQLGRANISTDKQVSDKLRKLEDKHTILFQQMETTRSQLMQVAEITSTNEGGGSADRFFWLAVVIVFLALGIVAAVALGWLG